jgi:DNA replication and repair protein RecF
MQLERFSAEHFRNLSKVEISLIAGMNVIYGENAQGKTNLLEAIYVLSTLRSFRTRQLNEVIQFGEKSALVHGKLQRGAIHHSLAVCVETDGKQASQDRLNVDAMHYVGLFDVFLFSFPLLEVVRGGPEERRRFFDRAIAVTRPGYLATLMLYHRALKQKNALLVSIQRNEVARNEGVSQLNSFNRQLIEHGEAIVKERTKYLNELQQLLDQKQQLFFSEISRFEVQLKSTFTGSGEESERLLQRNIDREIARGVSLFGVHRDEFLLSLNGNELRKYGSSGQHRACLLLMLLAQLQLYENLREDRPVLLLDDLDSELDQKRIQAFLSEISGKYQTLISTSRRELFAARNDIQLFEIQGGKLLEM